LANSKTVTLAVPDTYMNLSGKSVRKLSDSLSVPPENVIVVHDDLDLALGHVRIRNRGSAGGQNGIKDILKHLGNDAPFARVRIGIGRPVSARADVTDFVLGKFTPAERAELGFASEGLWAALQLIIQQGVDKASTRVQLDHKYVQSPSLSHVIRLHPLTILSPLIDPRRAHLIATGKMPPPRKPTTSTGAAAAITAHAAARANARKPKKAKPVDPLVALAMMRRAATEAAAAADAANADAATEKQDNQEQTSSAMGDSAEAPEGTVKHDHSDHSDEEAKTCDKREFVSTNQQCGA
jgi:PTH1 family peptidyl-tRNA hydrolase